MCGKYRFNQLIVGKQSNLSHSLEPAISCHSIRSDVNRHSDGPGFSQASQAASLHPSGHPALPLRSLLVPSPWQQ